MQNLMAFEYENKAIRVIHGENGEPWIVAPIMDWRWKECATLEKMREFAG